MILGVESDSSDSLIEAHRLALRSMKSATDAGVKCVDVEQQVLVTEASFDYSQYGIRSVQLATDARGLFGEGFRPLPLAGEVFERLGSFDADVVIVSNADIGLFHRFYCEVAQLFSLGIHSWTAHRRTIPTRRPNGEVSLAWVETQLGMPHEGSDLFVTTPSVASKMCVGNAVFGMPGVGDLILANLAALDGTFRRFGNARLTFHIEDERSWRHDFRSRENGFHNFLLREAALNLRLSIGSWRYWVATRRAGIGKFARRRLAGQLKPSKSDGLTPGISAARE